MNRFFLHFGLSIFAWHRLSTVLMMVVFLAAPGSLFAQTDTASSAPSPSPAAMADPSRVFVEAARAYDENRLDDAIAGWHSLLDAGQTLPPVLFNLGNAYYRNGQLGKAIRAYRQAQWLAPRDPDIRANLGFAAQTAGIPIPSPSGPAAFWMSLTLAEWLWLTLSFFWALAGIGAVAIWAPGTRHALRAPALLLFLLFLLAAVGIGLRVADRRAPEAVVMKSGQKLLSGPLDTATPLVALPEGSIVRPRSTHGVWVEVATPDATGWLPAVALSSVL